MKRYKIFFFDGMYQIFDITGMPYSPPYIHCKDYMRLTAMGFMP